MLRLGRYGISRSDLNQVYAGAYITFFTYLERSIEELFIGVVTNRFDYGRPDVRPLATFSNSAVATRIVYGGRKYADWIPFDLTKARADVFLWKGKPFADLATADAQSLDRLGVLRNAISHESEHARTRFLAEYVTGNALPPDQQRPSGYLRGMHAAGQTRLDFLMSGAVVVMRRMCT